MDNILVCRIFFNQRCSNNINVYREQILIVSPCFYFKQNQSKLFYFTGMKIAIFLLLQFLNLKAMSQTPVKGQYIFTRQEMAAGFNFLANGKFDFFFTYGAVDRNATGTFSVEGDTIKLKSNKEAGKDFIITSQTKEGTGYRIQFNDANKYLLTNIRCSFFIGAERHDEFTDDNGEIKVTYPHCDRIFAFHTLFPDVVTLIKDETNENNQFVLALNPSLEQVSFKGIDFKIENDGTFSCIPNYLIMLEDIKFKKQ